MDGHCDSLSSRWSQESSASYLSRDCLQEEDSSKADNKEDFNASHFSEEMVNNWMIRGQYVVFMTLESHISFSHASKSNISLVQKL